MTLTSMVTTVGTHIIYIQVTKCCGEEIFDKNEDDDNKDKELFGANEVVYMSEY